MAKNSKEYESSQKREVQEKNIISKGTYGSVSDGRNNISDEEIGSFSELLPPDFGDQLVVRVGKACNFRCNFCNVSDNERHVELKENVSDIVRNFHYKMKYSNFTSKTIEITISGGEPSIFQKETLFALKYISRFFEKKGMSCGFGIQTNASNISPTFAKQIYAHGIKYALVSFHTIDPEIFKETLGISYDSYFRKIIEGMNHLQNAGIQVDTNTILSQENKHNFKDTLIYLEKNFPGIKNFNVGVIQPHGEAEKNIETVAPKYSEIAPIYNDAISYLKSKGKRVTSHFVGLPACYLEDHSVSLEIQSNTLFRQNFNFNAQYLINSINDDNKIQIEACHTCMYNNICSGIWKKYVGYQEIKAPEYIKDYFGDFTQNKIAIKVSSQNEALKDIFVSGKKQVLLSTKIGSKQEIYKCAQEAIQLGFPKISLVIESDFDLDEDIFISGITNIQCGINHVSDTFLRALEKFSKKHAPQFRIDIDIFSENQGIPILLNYTRDYIHFYSINQEKKEVKTL